MSLNCLELRRRVLTDPRRIDGDMRAHLEQCPRCQAYLGQSQTLERSLGQALQLAAPEDLAERILLAQTSEVRRHQRRRWSTGLALAASLVLGLAMVLLAVAPNPDRPASLIDLAVAHLDHEPHALSARNRLPEPMVSRSFRQFGIDLGSLNQVVNYLALCPLGESTSIHMVSQQPEGPVTLLFTPNAVGERRVDFQRNGVQGRALSLAGGHLVLLADQDGAFDRLEQDWRDALIGPPSLAAGGR